MNVLHQKLKDNGINALGLLAGEYSATRMKENLKMAFFTDILIRGFGSRLPMLKLGRNVALDVIGNCNKLKNFFMRKAMGF